MFEKFVYRPGGKWIMKENIKVETRVEQEFMLEEVGLNEVEILANSDTPAIGGAVCGAAFCGGAVCGFGCAGAICGC